MSTVSDWTDEEFTLAFGFERVAETHSDKIIIPEEIWDAILACAIASQNSDSTSTNKAGNVVFDWLMEKADWPDDEG